MDKWKLGKVLGEGQFSKVVLGTLKNNNYLNSPVRGLKEPLPHTVAVKIFNRKKLQENDMENELLREVK